MAVEKKLKIILGLLVVILVIQIGFVLVILSLLKPTVSNSDKVEDLPREERLKLLETLWQSGGLKTSDAEFRRKAFESIVVE